MWHTVYIYIYTNMNMPHVLDEFDSVFFMPTPVRAGAGLAGAAPLPPLRLPSAS